MRAAIGLARGRRGSVADAAVASCCTVGKAPIGEADRSEPRAQQRPVEARTGIVLAPRRDVLVADDRLDRIAARQRRRQSHQRVVLRSLEGLAFQAFELDAQRVVVAVLAPAPRRAARVPGAPLAGDELQQFAAASQLQRFVVADVAAAFETAKRIEADEGRTFVHPYEGPRKTIGTFHCPALIWYILAALEII